MWKTPCRQWNSEIATRVLSPADVYPGHENFLIDILIESPPLILFGMGSIFVDGTSTSVNQARDQYLRIITNNQKFIRIRIRK
jgi:hypothetical protein